MWSSPFYSFVRLLDDGQTIAFLSQTGSSVSSQKRRNCVSIVVRYRDIMFLIMFLTRNRIFFSPRTTHNPRTIFSEEFCVSCQKQRFCRYIYEIPQKFVSRQKPLLTLLFLIRNRRTTYYYASRTYTYHFFSNNACHLSIPGPANYYAPMVALLNHNITIEFLCNINPTKKSLPTNNGASSTLICHLAFIRSHMRL